MLILLISFFAFSQAPQTLPKWELGLGYFYGDIPDYPGSEDNTVRAFPIPYFIYRGDIVRADRDGGLRTRFLRGTYYELDFSFSGGFPADSQDNAARQGMPDLDWLFELGTQLRVYLFTESYLRMQMRLPVRAVFSTDLRDTSHEGFTFSPELRWAFPGFPFSNQIFNFTLTHENATSELHRYFYNVPQEYVSAERPFYSSERGHIGVSYGLSLITRWKSLALFTGFRFTDYKKAENRDSPLHTTDYNRSYFAGIIYSFYQSDAQGSR